MLPRANWPSLTPLLRMSNLMSARGSLRGEPQIPAEANVCLRRHITYCVLGTHLSVPGEPLSSQPAQRHWGALRGTSEKQTGKFMCTTKYSWLVSHFFWQCSVWCLFVYIASKKWRKHENIRGVQGAAHPSLSNYAGQWLLQIKY